MAASRRPVPRAESLPPWAASAIVLALCSASILFVQWRAFGEPFPADITCYASVARGMREGRWLYADFFDNKSPGVFIAYWAASFLGGTERLWVGFLGALLPLLTLLGVFEAGRAFSGRNATGLWAAAFWALTCQDPRLWGHQPNPEAFLNLLSAWAVAQSVRLMAPTARASRALTAGLLWGTAACFKPTILLLPTLFAAHAAMLAIRNPKDLLQRGRLARFALSGATALLPLALPPVFFSLHGRAEAFRFWSVTFNRYYIGNLGTNLGEGLRPGRLFPSPVGFLFPPALLGGIGLAWSLRDRTKPWILGWLWCVAVWFQVAASGRFFPYYYQLWVVPAAVVGAWGLEAVEQAVPERLSVVIGFLGLLVLIPHYVGYASLPPGDRTRLSGVDTALDSRKVGEDIRNLLAPGEKYFEWAPEPLFYAEVGQAPPTPLLYGYNLFSCRQSGDMVFQNPLTPAMKGRILADLEKAGPELMVEDTHAAMPHGSDLDAYLVRNYKSFGLAGEGKRFRLSFRAGGALERRFARIPVGTTDAQR